MDKTIEILKETDALLTGHFLLSSGLHSNGYVQCAKLLRFPDKAAQVLKIVADKLKDVEIDIVCGPAMGGIIVSYEIGRQLGKESIFTERKDGVMELRRGFEVKKGQKVLITEDVVTTGKSSLETIEILKALGAEIVGIACIVDRRDKNVKLDYEVFSCVKLDIETFPAGNCPLCKEGKIPVIKPGSRGNDKK